MAKRRADHLLVDQGLAESRTRAQALILAGLVSAAGKRIDKPGTDLPDDTGLVDVDGGTAVRWIEGQGWVMESA